MSAGRKTKAHREYTATVEGNRLKPRISFWRAAFDRLKPSEWLEKNIKLPPGKVETKPGPIQFSQSPYLREIVDSADEVDLTDVIFVTATRLGKTFTLRAWFAWFVAGNPAPTNLYDSTTDKARSLSRRELQPLVAYNPILRAKKPRNRHHYSDLQMNFDGAPVQLYGGNSPAGAGGDTTVVILGNETDKWSGESTGGEAGMVDLVRHRTESHENERKHYFSSTPTTEGGVIWTEFLKGDQRKWFVPCPCCGYMQTLAWERVRFDKPGAKREDGQWDLAKVRDLARYVCADETCGAEWDDEMRLAAVRDDRAEWRATADLNTVVPGFRSYQLSGLCGPLKVNRIGELAVSFLTAKRSSFSTELRDFFNSRLGQPWLNRAVTFGESKMKESMLPYARGKLPEGWTADIIIIGVDVQTYGMPWTVYAWKWNGDVRTVDHGLAVNWADLDGIQKEYHPLAGRSFVVCDIGFQGRRTEALEEIFRRTQNGWKGAEGHEFSSRLVKLGNVNPFLGMDKAKHAASVPVLSISTYDIKCDIEKWFTREIPVWGIYTPEGEREEQEFHEHIAQLTDERRVKRKKRLAGQPEWEWKERTGQNHAFDTFVYAASWFWIMQRARAATDKAQEKKPDTKSVAHRGPTMIRR